MMLLNRSLAFSVRSVTVNVKHVGVRRLAGEFDQASRPCVSQALYSFRPDSNRKESYTVIVPVHAFMASSPPPS